MSRRKRLTALLLAAVITAGLTACDTAEHPPEDTQSLPVMSTASPEPEHPEFALLYAATDSLHPLEASDRSNLDVAALVYEGLYELDSTFTPQPLLAQSAEVSADGLVWTFTLRTDAAFSDGTLLTADHVVSSLRAAMKSGVYAVRLSGLASVKAKDGIVVITLKEPNGNLPALLDVPIVLEREEGLPLGTGPYVLDGDETQRWLVANPNWWQGRRAPYDTIPLRATHQLDERVSAFDSGLVTAVTTDSTAANALGYSSVYETYDFPTTDMLFVGFNTLEGACTSAPLRTALSRAFDRSSVVTSLLGGHGAAASLPVSPYSGEYDETVAAALEYDLEAVEALLDEAGYSRNEEGLLARGRRVLTLRLVVNQDSQVKQEIARFLAENLRQLGMDVTVDELGWDDYMTALTAGDFDLYLGEVRLTGDFDISSLISGTLNYGGYWDETVYTLLQTWKASSGGSREAAARALYEAMAGNPPFAALCFKHDSLLIRWGMVGNLKPVRGNPFAGVENWITENKLN